MMEFLAATVMTASLLFTNPESILSPVAGEAGQLSKNETVLSSETMDLGSRYHVESISNGFMRNILINVWYLVGTKPLILQPGEVFAFHKNILPQFKDEKIVTQESGFNSQDGYVAVAGLYGNGVCHLATLMNWVSSEAGLEVTALASHDFSPVPGIDRKYGTSIRYMPDGSRNSSGQNLYVKNTFDYPVEFKFSLENERVLRFTIVKAN